jgi:hypothetical protein
VRVAMHRKRRTANHAAVIRSVARGSRDAER